MFSPNKDMIIHTFPYIYKMYFISVSHAFERSFFGKYIKESIILYFYFTFQPVRSQQFLGTISKLQVVHKEHV